MEKLWLLLHPNTDCVHLNWCPPRHRLRTLQLSSTSMQTAYTCTDLHPNTDRVHWCWSPPQYRLVLISTPIQTAYTGANADPTDNSQYVLHKTCTVVMQQHACNACNVFTSARETMQSTSYGHWRKGSSSRTLSGCRFNGHSFCKSDLQRMNFMIPGKAMQTPGLIVGIS